MSGQGEGSQVREVSEPVGLRHPGTSWVAIRDLAHDPELRDRMRASARAFVEKSFHRDDQAEPFVRSLEEARAGVADGV